MADDVLLAKANLATELMRAARHAEASWPAEQGAALAALQRACDLAGELAARALAANGISAPESHRARYALMGKHGLIDSDLKRRMQELAHFRTLVFRSCAAPDARMVDSVMRERLGDFAAFAEAARSVAR